MSYYTCLTLNFAFPDEHDSAAGTIAIAALLNHDEIVHSAETDVSTQTLETNDPFRQSALIRAFSERDLRMERLVREADSKHIVMLSERGNIVRATALTHDVDARAARVSLTLLHKAPLNDLLHDALTTFAARVQTDSHAMMTHTVISEGTSPF